MAETAVFVQDTVIHLKKQLSYKHSKRNYVEKPKTKTK